MKKFLLTLGVFWYFSIMVSVRWVRSPILFEKVEIEHFICEKTHKSGALRF